MESLFNQCLNGVYKPIRLTMDDYNRLTARGGFKFAVLTDMNGEVTYDALGVSHHGNTFWIMPLGWTDPESCEAIQSYVNWCNEMGY